MYFEYETPVCSLVMMWSTPSSRKAQVVARSAEAGGIGWGVLLGVDEDEVAMMVVVWRGETSKADQKSLPQRRGCGADSRVCTNDSIVVYTLTPLCTQAIPPHRSVHAPPS